MKFVNVLALGGLLVAPGVARAQAVTQEALVGTWQGGSPVPGSDSLNSKHTFTLKADGIKKDEHTYSRWWLTGDTLWLGGGAFKIEQVDTSMKNARSQGIKYKPTLDKNGQQLSLFPDSAGVWKKSPLWVYQRRGSGQP